MTVFQGHEQRAASDGCASITLAVPYYSGFELFRRTLRSIAAQTHPACRVLVVDDSPSGLSREERAEIEVLVGPTLPLRLLRNQQNLGMARTWNRCLDDAETDLVTIVHSDDELEPGYAAAMVRLAAEHPSACALFAGAKIIGAEGHAAFSFPDLYKELLIPRHGEALVLSGDRALRSILRGNYIFCPSVCYRRSRLRQERFDPRFRMVLDIDLTTRLLLQGETLVGVPRARLYRYRRHEQNATQHLTKELTRFTEESELYLELAVRAAARGYARAARTARRRWIIQANLLFCIARDAVQRDGHELARKLRLFRELFLQPGRG